MNIIQRATICICATRAITNFQVSYVQEVIWRVGLELSLNEFLQRKRLCHRTKSYKSSSHGSLQNPFHPIRSQIFQKNFCVASLAKLNSIENGPNPAKTCKQIGKKIKIVDEPKLQEEIIFSEKCMFFYHELYNCWIVFISCRNSWFAYVACWLRQFFARPRANLYLNITVRIFSTKKIAKDLELFQDMN